MESLDRAFRKMNFEFFGRSLHKISPAAFFGQAGAVFVDLRSEEERGILPVTLPGLRCLHIPLHELPERWEEIPLDLPVGLFCSSDNRSAMAFAYLGGRGYVSVRIIAGGYEALVGELKPGKVYKRLTAGA